MFKKIMAVVLLLSLLVVPFLTSALNEQSPFEFIKLFVLGNVSLCVFTAVVFAILREKKIEFRWNHGLSLIGTILVVNSLSFSFSNNQMMSFWADINVPTDSLLTIIVFFLFCFSCVQVFTSAREIRGIKYIVTVMATLLATYGIVQHFGLDPVDWWGYRHMRINAYGTIGQAVGFGMIVGSSIFLPLTSFLQAKGLFRKAVFLLSLFIMAMGILYSGSRTPALAALFVSVAGLGAYLLKNRSRQALKTSGLVLLVLAGAQIFYYYEGRSSALGEKLTAESISHGFGERTYIWEDAIAIWKKYPILGSGPETFSTEQKIVNRREHNQYQHWELLWTKAHNHYIHHLATTGVAGLAAELLLLFFLLFDLYRLLRRDLLTDNDLDGIGFALGYLFLAINYLTAFNFVFTQLFSYLFPTLYFAIRAMDRPNIIEIKLPRKLCYAAAVCSFVLVVMLIQSIFHYWRADVLFGKSKREFLLNKNPAEALKAIDEAIEIQKYNPRLYCRKATIITALLTSSPNRYSQQETANTIKLIDALTGTCVNLDTSNAENISVRGKLFAELFLTHLVPDTSVSLQAFQDAIKVNPNNPTYYYRMGSLYLASNRPDEYVASMKAALDLKADYLPAYTDLIGFYYRRGDHVVVENLVQNVAKLKIDKAEFLPELGNMINLAELNKDSQSRQILLNTYMSVRHLAESQ